MLEDKYELVDKELLLFVEDVLLNRCAECHQHGSPDKARNLFNNNTDFTQPALPACMYEL